MEGLRLVLFDGDEGLSLYARLPEGRRVLVDCGAAPDAEPLGHLRRMGEVDRLHPLDQYLRPAKEPPELWRWLGILSLLRGLVLRPGGSWVFWSHEKAEPAGFCLRAQVAARAMMPAPPRDIFPQAPLLVMGLSPEEVMDLGGPPGAWVCNCSLAVRLGGRGAAGGHLLVGGDLRAGAWQRLLADDELKRLVSGVSVYAAGEPDRGHDLSRGLLMACLPWLLLGLMDPERGAWPDGACDGPRAVCTPPVGILQIDVDQRGTMIVRGRPRAQSGLVWQGLARSPQDAALPAPWPLRRALAGN